MLDQKLKRRTFLSIMLASVVCRPFNAAGQTSSRIPRIGVLWHAADEKEEEEFLTALREGLAKFGHIEGKNIILENRFADEHYDRFNAQASELVASKVDILVAGVEPSALAAQRATQTIPIVVILSPDPVGSKLVQSLGRPGGNITGTTTLTTPLVPKRFQLLRECVPTASSVAILLNANDEVIAQRT